MILFTNSKIIDYEKANIPIDLFDVFKLFIR